jgi:glycosyltransferase involved in cell wall biosynthesis
MPAAIDFPKLIVLHVLTLNGRNGEYGGPVRVARELCAELARRGHAAHIISGAREGSEPISKDGLSESFVFVKPISKKMEVSSLWSWGLVPHLSRQIRKADIVHIHFARDLIPLLAGLICIFLRKPYVTQTHGMLGVADTKTKRFVDFVLTRIVMYAARKNLYLTHDELRHLSALYPRGKYVLMPNGISIPHIGPPIQKEKKFRVVFCARINARKRPDLFLEVARILSANNSDYEFKIYGPDGGMLEEVLNLIKISSVPQLSYEGSIKSDEVIETLKHADLLILPSEEEPFPMVILECLSVGTPVIVMPDCGLAEIFKTLPYGALPRSPSPADIVDCVTALRKFDFYRGNPEILSNFASQNFQIRDVCNSLIDIYEFETNEN